MPLPIPLQVIYAGLVGVILALIIATAQQKWKLKVFFLLALRLAIGWQFLFEGLHKIHSHYVADPTFQAESDTIKKPFSSERYFKEAPGPIAPYVRAMNGDTAEFIASHLTPKQDITPAEFEKLTPSEQAALCPDAAAKSLDDYAATLGKGTEPEKILYASWVYGVSRRPIPLSRISGDVEFTGPQRMKFLKLLKKEVEQAEDRERLGLGYGYGLDIKKTQAARVEFWNAQDDLVKEINTFLKELKTKINDGKEPVVQIVEKKSEFNDRITRWFIAIIGACILFGFLTRISCILAAGFLLLTYLTYPPFPWFVLPPGTEGNPLFINKNAIEFFALLALACMPTGKWLGLDAMISYLFGRKPKAPATTRV